MIKHYALLDSHLRDKRFEAPSTALKYLDYFRLIADYRISGLTYKVVKR
jgi:hypothetical protein